ncbi:MAG TPA: hypothetical protein VKQ07_07495 [Jatrophihabitantaceae bacterium]|nr:hypothetical protein [Jatrophihabitantaceae bacterium]
MTSVDERSVRDLTDATPQVSNDTRRRDVYVIFWVATGLMTIASLVRNGYIFTTAQYPGSDQALNSLLVNRAEQFQQLVGNYSRVRFHHPGPALFYILSWGQGLFHDVLHIVPAPYNGQLLAATLYGAAMIGLTLVCLYRLIGSRGATAVAFGIAFVFAARYDMLGNVWFPFLYMAAFLLFTVASAAVAIGRTTELPLYVLGAGLLAHGHVSFLLFVAVTTVVVVAGWVWRHRHAWLAELRAHRRGVYGSGVLLGLFALPIVLETSLHYPGQWADYWTYVTHAQRTPRTFGQILDFMGQYWTTRAVPVGLSVAAAVVAVVLTATERNRERRQVFLALYGSVVLQSLLSFYYMARGVDALDRINWYVGLFYMTVPLVLVLAATAQLWIRLTELSAPAVPRIATTGVAVAAVVALSADATTMRELAMPQVPKAGYPAIVTALRDDPARAGRTVEFDLDEHDTWPIAAGVAEESWRTGLAWCVRDGFQGLWSVLFDSSNICPSSGAANRWQVHFSYHAPLPSDARVIVPANSRRMPVTIYSLPGHSSTS